jgi:PAS domain S-box-containing protein
MTLTISNLSPFKRRSAGSEEIHALLDLLPHPALIASARTGRILFANGPATELSAYTRKELSELDLATLLPGLAPSARGKQASTLIKRNSQPVSVQASLTHLNGNEHWVAIMLETAASAPVATDTAQRWEALHMLSLAAQQPELSSAYRQILQAGALLTGAQHLVLYTPSPNGALQVQAVHGSGMDFPATLEAKDVATLRVPKVWQSGRPIESQLQRAAHASKLSYLASTPLDLTHPEAGLLAAADENAAPSDVLLTLLQILGASASAAALNAEVQHAWRRDAARLAEHEQVTAVLREHMQDGVLFVDASLQLTELNMAAEAMLGYSQNEVLQRPVQEVLIGTRTLLPELEMALQNNQVMEVGKRKLLRRDGQEFLALVRIAPIAPQGKLARLAILISDLSEHEAFHLQTLQMSDRAWLGDVAAIFAHEMQNPLNNISTGLQVMQMGLSENDPSHAQLQSMLEDCERLARYMHSMLGVARGRAHQPEPMDIAEFCRQQMARWRVRLQRKNIQDHLHIGEHIPLIMGDAHALEQVFTNLFTNAMQAMSGQERGLLALNVSASGDGMVEVVISDNGPGVPEELRSRIFEAFFTTKGGEGTGLGLSITRRIVMAHKGEITLESFPGGTLFKLRLPVVQN